MRIVCDQQGKREWGRRKSLPIKLEIHLVASRTHVYHRLGDYLVLLYVKAGRVHGCVAVLDVNIRAVIVVAIVAVTVGIVANTRLPRLNINPALLASRPVLPRPHRCRPSKMLPSTPPAGPLSGDSIADEEGLCSTLRAVERLLLRLLVRMKNEDGRMWTKMGRRVGRLAAIT